MENTEFTKVFLRKNSFRKAVRDLAITELKKARDDLDDIILEREKEEQLIAAERAAKQEAIDKIAEMMKANGISQDDLNVIGSAPKRKVVEARYQCTDEHGETHLWSGRGRPPIPFKEAMDKGAKKTDFLIENSN